MELYGIEWLQKIIRYIKEDEADNYRILSLIAPIARTSMDKKSGQALVDYAKDFDRMLKASTPWRKSDRAKRIRGSGRVKPGEVVVILDAGESSSHPLYENAKVLRN